jgi:hypothetical protein
VLPIILFQEKTYFLTYTLVHGKFIMMANGASIPVLGMGTVSLTINGIVVKLIQCYHTPGLRASLYSLHRHRQTHVCSFLGDHNGMYLTFGRVFTRFHDEIDYRIQLRPLPYHSSTKYALDHTVPPIQVPSQNQFVHPPIKQPTPPIPTEFIQHPVTYCVPTPKTDSPSSRFQPLAPLKPTPKDYPITGSPTIRRLAEFDVYRYISFHHLRDYTALHQVGTGVKVVLQGEPPLPPSDLTTIDRNNKGKTIALPQHYLEKFGMDIVFGHKESAGGFKYSLLVVDYKTRHNFIYGLRAVTGEEIHNAFLAFFIEDGGIPGTIQCDFDTKFLAGSARQLILERGIRLQAAPGGRKSQNGLAKSHWKQIVRIARSLLVDRGMPKSLWFFALRHAVQVCNYLPVVIEGNITTAFEQVHKSQPNFQAILYPIFSHGYFHRTGDINRECLQFEPQTQPGIAIGHSELANGIMFWNPVTNRISVSADYQLDPLGHLPSPFNIKFNGPLECAP